MRVRALEWGDFQSWVDLYYTRYAEIDRNPELGVFLMPAKPSLGEEATFFGQAHREMAEGHVVTAVAEEGGAIVGVCFVRRKGRHVEDRHLGALGLVVHPEHRRQGIGGALLDYALRASVGKFEIVQLAVVDVNERAMRLYRRFGFEEYGRAPRAFKRGERYFDEVLMSIRLDQGPRASQAPPRRGPK
ncbi:MAG: GNAT family N-acetyltransferase [Candidatus Lutacidiplasmatales archaeon]